MCINLSLKKVHNHSHHVIRLERNHRHPRSFTAIVKSRLVRRFLYQINIRILGHGGYQKQNQSIIRIYVHTHVHDILCVYIYIWFFYVIFVFGGLYILAPCSWFVKGGELDWSYKLILHMVLNVLNIPIRSYTGFVSLHKSLFFWIPVCPLGSFPSETCCFDFPLLA